MKEGNLTMETRAPSVNGFIGGALIGASDKGNRKLVNRENGT